LWNIIFKSENAFPQLWNIIFKLKTLFHSCGISSSKVKRVKTYVRIFMLD
jgi:hypothetical protein